MSDIYKQKAEKYKYKYLKLKQELEGGDEEYNDCMISPSILFNDELLKNIEQKYNLHNYHINYFNNDINYVGRLIKFKKIKKFTNNLQIELNNFTIIKENNKIDETYTPEIVYACIINNNKSFFSLSSTSSIYETLDKIFLNSTKSDINTKYGLIISTNPGKKLKNLYYDINNYLPFINYLKIAIQQFIIPLHKAGYVLNNIDLNNIYWDEKKVFFNISEMTENINNNIDIQGLTNSIYKLFNKFSKEYNYNNHKYLIIKEYNCTDQLLKAFCNDKSININDLVTKLDYISESIEKYKDYLEKTKLLDINTKKLLDELRTLEQLKENRIHKLGFSGTQDDGPNSIIYYNELISKINEDFNPLIKLKEDEINNNNNILNMHWENFNNLNFMIYINAQIK
jgi:hypothetical protein